MAPTWRSYFLFFLLMFPSSLLLSIYKGRLVSQRGAAKVKPIHRRFARKPQSVNNCCYCVSTSAMLKVTNKRNCCSCAPRRGHPEKCQFCSTICILNISISGWPRIPRISRAPNMPAVLRSPSRASIASNTNHGDRLQQLCNK